MRQADEQRAERSKKGSSRSAGRGRAAGGLITFHPNAAQREELKTSPPSLDQALLGLAKIIERGCGVSLGYSVDRASSFALIRDKEGKWDEADALSVWHSDLIQAVVGLWYALKTIYPDFPENMPAHGTFNDEW